MSSKLDRLLLMLRRGGKTEAQIISSGLSKALSDASLLGWVDAAPLDKDHLNVTVWTLTTSGEMAAQEAS